MKSLTVALLVVATVLLGVPLTKIGIDVIKKESTTQQILSQNYKEQSIPKLQTDLNNQTLPKIQTVKKTLVLEARNTVTLRGPVTTDSVSDVMKQLQKMSRSLNKDSEIYLVLDTPGGSVVDGMELIDMAEGLPQKIHTVTLFAASMGFQIAQNLDVRYIIRSGTLMSHRARLSGLGGQVKGELEERYKMIRRQVDYLDIKASNRMGLTLPVYEKLIFNEYWVHGFDAVSDKAADEQVLVQCGSSMDGNEKVTFMTFFGPINVVFAKCPLIKAPISVDFGNVRSDAQNFVKNVFSMSIENKEKYVKDYIVTDKFLEVFP